MTYRQTLDYLYSQLPMFHRIGSAAYKANLNNTIAICSLLGRPENKFNSVHIAGTNGKGSVSHMLAAVLQSAGYKTGLYTSPHLKDFRERIRINGKMIPKNYVSGFVKKYRDEFEKIKPSFFEWTVGLAFEYFAEKKVDIAVIEVGLGGRLDSTNVITPLLSVITNISYDHVNLLGSTLKKIAEEKGGIIKPYTPVVISETQAEVKTVFEKIARKNHSPVFFADQLYKVKNLRLHKHPGKLKLVCDVYAGRKKKLKNLSCGLPGFYQEKNISAVISNCEVLSAYGYTVNENSLRRGISGVTAITGLQGRWQVLGKKPLIIADTGHNEAGLRKVIKQIRLTRYRRLHFILGVVNDKDISKILSLLPTKAVYYFCKASIPRALDEKTLALQAISKGLRGNTYPTVVSALNAAKKAAKKNDLIFIGGSTFTVADAL